MATIKSQITPCLWFDRNAEEAAKFYTTVFKKSKKGKSSYYGKNSPMPEGTVAVAEFEILGQKFMALNGGPYFKLSEAVSFVVNCKTQKEIDYYWEKLSKGGEKSQCGWLKDKFGLSWQIMPENINKMLTGNAAKANRVMQAVWKMRKIDIKTLEKVYAGK
jgi:predicted 3-demethylubiquinone-9 3-methyltransferase (glyoxalase superfamily)